MALLRIQNVKLAFGGPLLLDDVSFSVDKGERIALVGRNGTGKSTCLRLISGTLPPDSGTVVIQKGASVAFLPQEIPHNLSGAVSDVIYGNQEQNWKIKPLVDKVVSQLKLNPELIFDTLSAGLKRQVLFGRALALEPDICLLDEPTNHMDIESIKRVEGLIGNFKGALLFVTHDRAFLRRIASRIIEIDRGKTFDQSCDYDTFIERKEAALHAEKSEQNVFDKKLLNEERWIRQGIKARRTRNEGRVKELKEMRKIRKSRRDPLKLVKMTLHEGERSGKIVAETDDICFGYGDSEVISNLSTTILRGDRVGILGPNGIGKTTLLNILLGNLQPDSGKVRVGTGLQLSYFDQTREQLDETKNVKDNVAEGKEFIAINGKTKHVIGYLKDFLFSPDQAQAPVSALSGGERNRLLLARLFTRPSNLLVLDEPTNDLDVETLELLEELLIDYSGTIIVVSHDREFINNVVTSTIVFEGNGVVKEYVGGYEDWLRQKNELKEEEKKKRGKKEQAQSTQLGLKKRKPGYMQKRELEALPGKIDALENEQEELFKVMSDPGFFKQGKNEIIKMNERLESIKKMLAESYARWEKLEGN